jgi:tetratricopeptide (TPR) repeat protein
MESLLSILTPVVVLGLGAAIAMTIMTRPKGNARGRVKRAKSRDAVLKDAAKRLAQNPRDPAGLQGLGDIYYKEENWDLAYKTYETLVEVAGTSTGVDEFEANLRYGISAIKLGLTEPAYKGLAMANTINPGDFEVCYNLGTLEFQKKNYEKAIQHLSQALTKDPEHAPTLRALGHAFFMMKKYTYAMNYIRQAIDLDPEDKESLYTLAECYFEVNQTEQALRIFTHLRADPVMGAGASLFSGIINTNRRQDAKAMEDFEIGLKHPDINPEVRVEFKYRLAPVYLKQNEIDSALTLLRDVQAINASYKDVDMLIDRYEELNANKNLQIFLMAPSADFVVLCRKIVMGYYQRARVKITNVSVQKNEWADLLVEVDSSKWSDVVMFRFIRTEGCVGEMSIRDFHSHLREVKAGKGICSTVGTFSDEAKRYTEARLIDLIERARLMALLNMVDARSADAAAASDKPPAEK